MQFQAGSILDFKNQTQQGGNSKQCLLINTEKWTLNTVTEFK